MYVHVHVHLTHVNKWHFLAAATLIYSQVQKKQTLALSTQPVKAGTSDRKRERGGGRERER